MIADLMNVALVAVGAGVLMICALEGLVALAAWLRDDA